jgi:hypothetical protein
MKPQERPCNGLTLLSKKQHDTDDNEVASACEGKQKSAMKPQERPCNGLTLLSKKQHDTDDIEVASTCERKCKSAMMPQQVRDADATRIETSFGLSLLRRMKQQDPTGVGRWQLATSRHECRNERQ